MTGDLRKFPNQSVTGGNGGGTSFGERLAAVEAHMAHSATKQDISDLGERLAAVEAHISHGATQQNVSDLRSDILGRINLMIISLVGGFIALAGTLVYATSRIVISLAELLSKSITP